MKKEYYQTRIPPTAQRVFSGIIFDIYQWQQKVFDGSFATFEMAKKLDGVSVVAIKNGKIVMLHEEQPLRDPYWATPGGHMERTDRSPFEAIARELLEETGMTFKSVKLVIVEFIGNTKLEWYAYRFVASDFVSQVAPRPEAGERIVIHEMTFDEACKVSLHNP
ncbi:MAG TPA: NUDIX domain-containing protein, partial [Candidatus Saccharimonadales bacterium]|nr:NUDIX domain-containing protein [Candidatus Saccharimonadales bacterium]